jgi:type I restriction enzyme S subunit
MKLRHLATLTNSNVDKIVEADQLPVRLCNYVDVYKNDTIDADMEFSSGSATPAELAKFHLEVGDVIITKDSEDPWDIGVPAYVRSSADDLVCGYHLTMLRRNPRRVVGRYLFWSLQSKPTRDALSIAATGVTRFGLTLDAMKDIQVPVPDQDTQKAIADFLDRETARIDQLIEKKQRFLMGASSRITALVDVAISDPDVPRIRFENVTHRVARHANLSDHGELVRLGLYNRGRGIFKKPAADEEGMGASDFFFVKAGDLILSGQFAWEGAVALATDTEEGCVVSHRYPIYRGRSGVKTAYLLGLLRSGFGNFLLNEASRGSAGRNRPLNTWRLGKEKIPIPDSSLQEAVEHAVVFERRLKLKTEESIDRLRELRSALITAAVTGQIDVATWRKRGRTDRQLDRIEEALAKSEEATAAPASRPALPTLVAAEIVHRHRNTQRFGRVKLQKVLYLAQAHAGVHELDGHYLREAAGPLDRDLMARVEAGMERAGYFRACTDGRGSRTAYEPLGNAGAHKAALKAQLGDRAERLSRLLDLLVDFEKKSVEAIATLYAVWNDALMDGGSPDEQSIIRGVLEDWHPEKGAKFREDELQHWLGWMRRNHVVPRGLGPKTETGRLLV